MLNDTLQNKIDSSSAANSFLQKKELNNRAFKQSVSFFSQPKPTTNVPDDMYEKEAEHLADSIMRTLSPPFVQIKRLEIAARLTKEKFWSYPKRLTKSIQNN